jgi:hypothetical protein
MPETLSETGASSSGCNRIMPIQMMYRLVSKANINAAFTVYDSLSPVSWYKLFYLSFLIFLPDSMEQNCSGQSRPTIQTILTLLSNPKVYCSVYKSKPLDRIVS